MVWRWCGPGWRRRQRSGRRAGGHTECVLFPGQPHVFALAETIAADRAIETIKRFMAGQVAVGG